MEPIIKALRQNSACKVLRLIHNRARKDRPCDSELQTTCLSFLWAWRLCLPMLPTWGRGSHFSKHLKHCSFWLFLYLHVGSKPGGRTEVIQKKLREPVFLTPSVKWVLGDTWGVDCTGPNGAESWCHVDLWHYTLPFKLQLPEAQRCVHGTSKCVLITSRVPRAHGRAGNMESLPTRSLKSSKGERH